MKPTKETILQRARGHSDDPRFQDSWITGAEWGIAQMSDLYTNNEVRSLIYSAYAAASEFDLDSQEFWELNKKKV